MKLRIPWFRRENPHASKQDVTSWVVREDGGLTEEESLELEALKKENAGFKGAFRKSRKAWELLNNISPELAFDTSESRPSRVVLFRPIYRELAVAALLTLSILGAWFFTSHNFSDNDLFFTETRSTIEPWTQRLPDGSMIRLNANTKVEVSFTPEYRQVRLMQGEAHFSVAKAPDRPFRVFANEVRVQAVGTAFNVRLLEDEIDVLVTEGTVEVAPGVLVEQTDLEDRVASETRRNAPSFVTSGQRATVSLDEQDLGVDFKLSLADADIIEASLSWQKSLLTFGGDSLDVIAASFEQKTGVKLIIADPDLHELKIGGQFPSENVKGFLQVLRSGYGIQWSEKSDGTFVIGDSH